jgi:hypothetical protein
MIPILLLFFLTFSLPSYHTDTPMMSLAKNTLSPASLTEMSHSAGTIYHLVDQSNSSIILFIYLFIIIPVC